MAYGQVSGEAEGGGGGKLTTRDPRSFNFTRPPTLAFGGEFLPDSHISISHVAIGTPPLFARIDNLWEGSSSIKHIGDACLKVCDTTTVKNRDFESQRDEEFNIL